LDDKEADRYDLVETTAFLKDVEGLAGSLQQWDEIKSAIDWALSTDPRIGRQISETAVWALPIESRPMFTVYYTIDEGRRVVTLQRAFRLAE
jgi:hypothetical protein